MPLTAARGKCVREPGWPWSFGTLFYFIAALGVTNEGESGVIEGDSETGLRWAGSFGMESKKRGHPLRMAFAALRIAVGDYCFGAKYPLRASTW
jgi:hypothetical protein